MRNVGKDDVTCAVERKPALTTYSMGDALGLALYDQIQYAKQYADIRFTESFLTIKAGGEGTVSLSVTPSNGLNATRLPLYSGYVTLSGSNGEKLSIPYIGVAGK